MNVLVQKPNALHQQRGGVPRYGAGRQQIFAHNLVGIPRRVHKVQVVQPRVGQPVDPREAVAVHSNIERNAFGDFVRAVVTFATLVVGGVKPRVVGAAGEIGPEAKRRLELELYLGTSGATWPNNVSKLTKGGVMNITSKRTYLILVGMNRLRVIGEKSLQIQHVPLGPVRFLLDRVPLKDLLNPLRFDAVSALLQVTVNVAGSHAS